MKRSSVIIIGAGASGLMAASELAADTEVTVLEAQSITGGRIGSYEMQGCLIETGAEFVHGNPGITLGLLKKAGLDYTSTEGKMYRKKDNGFEEPDEIAAGMDKLLKKMKALKEDMPMQSLLEKYFDGEENASLRKQIKSYVEGFDLGDVNKVSVKALCREWEGEEEENHRIKGGYTALLQYLQGQAVALGCKFHLQTVIKKVKWKKGNVTVYTAIGKEFSAEKLLVTIPVSMLSNGYIQYDPPNDFIETMAKDIGFGAVIKVVVQFKNVFWQKDAGFVLSDELFPTWWTQLPDTIPVLTGWLGGPKAVPVSQHTEEEITEMALSSLAALFNMNLPQIKEQVVRSKVFNWQKNEFIMGGYSYDTIHSAAARKKLLAPIQDTIFFAGEGLYSGPHPGTVEAAFVSGLDAARDIKSRLLLF